MTSYTINETTAGQRLDVFAGQKHPSISRAFVQKLIDGGQATVNSASTKAGYKLRIGDKVALPDMTASSRSVVPDIELPIIYQDDDCVVIDKPVGVLTHDRGGSGPREASVASFLRHYVSGIDGERAGVVHRLDRATSGVILGARNPAALSWLQKQFSQRKVKKAYLAIIAGHLAQPEAIIDMPIERNPKAPATFRVGVNGKTASTHYQVIQQTKHYSLLELRPETGRTHQLRVHLAHLGHPIVGDTLYGGQPAPRLFLHARQLEITMPSRERRTFDAPVPSEFAEFLETDA